MSTDPCCHYVRGKGEKFSWRMVLETLEEEGATAKKAEEPAGAVKK